MALGQHGKSLNYQISLFIISRSQGTLQKFRLRSDCHPLRQNRAYLEVFPFSTVARKLALLRSRVRVATAPPAYISYREAFTACDWRVCSCLVHLMRRGRI